MSRGLGDVYKRQVLMMSIDMKPKFTDNEKKMVKTAANFLGKHMES